MRESSIKAIISLPEKASTATSIKTSLMLLERSARKSNLADEVFVAILRDFTDIERIVSAFRAFQDGKITESEHMFSVNIASPRKLNVSYLQGTFFETQMQSELQHPLVRLYEIANLTTGAQIERIGKSDPNGKSYYARAGNIGDFVVNLDNTDKMTPIIDIGKWLAKPGDILFTRAGTVGRVALVTENSPQIVIGSNVAKISILERDRVVPEYIVAFLASKQGLKQIAMYTTGAVIKSISSSALGQIKIPLPPIQQQKQVAQQVRRIIDSKHETSNVIQKMRAREEQLRKELVHLTEA